MTPGARSQTLCLSVLLLLLSVAFHGVLPNEALGIQNVTLILNASPNGLHTGIVYAQRKGFYTRAGLLVTIERGRGSGHSVRQTVTRQTAFAVGELAAVIEARTQGLDVYAVTLLMDRFPGMLIALEKSGIKKAIDLKGKRLASPPSSFSRILFPMFAQRTNLPIRTLRWKDISPQDGIIVLLAGKTDAVVTSETSRWRYERAARRKNLKVTSFPYIAEGVDIYSLSLVTSLRMIEEKPEVVRNLVDSTIRGIAQAMEHPVEANELFMKTFPSYRPEIAAHEWRVYLKNWSPEKLKNPGLGFFEKNRVATLQSLLIRGRQLTEELPPERFFTNRFTPSVRVKLTHLN